MKRIVEYRKLLNVDKTVTLKELKTIYRNAMKESHPDKFSGDDEGLKAAEEQSKSMLQATTAPEILCNLVMVLLPIHQNQYYLLNIFILNTILYTGSFKIPYHFSGTGNS